MSNLVSNAVKYTPEGGVVTVSLAAEQTSVVLQVQDTGIGIPADKLQIIFERFTQASHDTMSKYGGTGLGLNITKNLVELRSYRLRISPRK